MGEMHLVERRDGSGGAGPSNAAGGGLRVEGEGPVIDHAMSIIELPFHTAIVLENFQTLARDTRFRWPKEPDKPSKYVNFQAFWVKPPKKTPFTCGDG